MKKVNRVTILKVKIEETGNYRLGSIDGDISADKPTIIDWGNGTATTLTAPITDSIPEGGYVNYSKPGEYEISIDGWYNYFKCGDYGTWKSGIKQINNVLTEVIQVSSLITSFYSTFSDCSSLTSIPDGLFGNNTKTTSFVGTFSGCSSLTNIPDGLFDKNAKVTSFTSTFVGCSSLKSIPSGLFDKNANVISFERAFKNCSGLTSIPSGLFDNNMSVTNFYETFYNCSSLTSIPSGLFDKNTNVTDFSYTFYKCKNLTDETPYTLLSDGTKIKLWDRDGTNEFTKPTSTDGAFTACDNLADYKDIPDNWK